MSARSFNRSSRFFQVPWCNSPNKPELSGQLIHSVGLGLYIALPKAFDWNHRDGVEQVLNHLHGAAAKKTMKSVILHNLIRVVNGRMRKAATLSVTLWINFRMCRSLAGRARLVTYQVTM
jgi:hypothetical protein